MFNGFPDPADTHVDTDSVGYVVYDEMHDMFVGLDNGDHFCGDEVIASELTEAKDLAKSYTQNLGAEFFKEFAEMPYVKIYEKQKTTISDPISSDDIFECEYICRVVFNVDTYRWEEK